MLAGMRALRPSAAAALAALALVPAAPAGARAGPRLDAVERAALRLVDARRAARGERGLRADRRLAAGADRQAAAMARHRRLQHDSFSGAPWYARVRAWARSATIGEVIGVLEGFAARRQARAIVAAWMRSPPHRAVLLDRRFRRAGIARRPGGGAAWFVLDVAR